MFVRVPKIIHQEEVKERQAFQERLEKLCTWSAENLKDVLAYSPGTVSNQRSATGVAGGLSYVEKLWELDEHSHARILGICLGMRPAHHGQW